MTDLQTLCIEFRGVCTHFHNNILPAIPHRVVIPDCTPKRRGILSVPTDSNWLDYEVEPHITTIKMEGVDFTQEGLISEHELFTRCALRIENAVGDLNDYDPSFKGMVPTLSDFVQNYTYATSVVLEGRATAYFDFHSGVKFSGYQEEGSADIRVRAEVTTNGAPRLRVTAFADGDKRPGARTRCFELTDVSKTLVIANVATDEAYALNDGKYDYVLHFLTERGGIARFYTQPLPGMPSSEYGSDLDAACSDSRYP